MNMTRAHAGSIPAVQRTGDQEYLGLGIEISEVDNDNADKMSIFG